MFDFCNDYAERLLVIHSISLLFDGDMFRALRFASRFLVCFLLGKSWNFSQPARERQKKSSQGTLAKKRYDML